MESMRETPDRTLIEDNWNAVLGRHGSATMAVTAHSLPPFEMRRAWHGGGEARRLDTKKRERTDSS